MSLMPTIRHYFWNLFHFSPLFSTVNTLYSHDLERWKIIYWRIIYKFWKWFCRNQRPSSAAMYNGVRLRLSRLFTWAPFRTSRSTIFSWPKSIREILSLKIATLHINLTLLWHLWKQLLVVASNHPDFFHSHLHCFESMIRPTINFLHKSIQINSIDRFSTSSQDSPSKMACWSANFDRSLFEIIQYYFLPLKIFK